MPDSPSDVTVVMPTTYRRAGSLPWSLASVLTQNVDVPEIGRARILILDNDKYPERVDQAIDRAVRQVGRGRWELQVIHRDPPLYPVYSWYEGIRDYTELGEIVIFEGDDDLMLPDAVATRVRMINQGGWDLLLTRARVGLWFTEKPGESEARALLPVGLSDLPRVKWDDPKPLSADRLCNVYGIFINNHTYRRTPLWWKAYEETLELMDCIPGDKDDKYSMLPEFYVFPFVDAGKAGYADTDTCIRGEAVESLLASGRGRVSWRKPGLYSLNCLWVFDGPLKHRKEYDSFRRNYRTMSQRWFLQSLGMPYFRQTLRGRRLLRSFITPQGMLQLGLSASDMIRSILGVNALSLRWRQKREPGLTLDALFPPS